MTFLSPTLSSVLHLLSILASNKVSQRGSNLEKKHLSGDKASQPTQSHTSQSYEVSETITETTDDLLMNLDLLDNLNQPSEGILSLSAVEEESGDDEEENIAKEFQEEEEISLRVRKGRDSDDEEYQDLGPDSEDSDDQDYQDLGHESGDSDDQDYQNLGHDSEESEDADKDQDQNQNQDQDTRPKRTQDLASLQVIQHHGCFWNTPILAAIDVHVHSELQLAICRSCQTGLLPAGIWGHMIEKHPELKRMVKNLGCKLKDAKAHSKSLKDRQLLSQEPRIPEPFLVPITGLAILPVAYYCPYVSCQKTSLSENYLKKHMRSNHPDLSHNISPIQCKAQQFHSSFAPFPVQEPQHTRSMSSLFQDFEREILQNLPSFQEVPVSKKHDRDLPPYLNITQWNLLLDQWYHDGEEREKIKEILELPKMHKPLYFLKDLCFSYLINVKNKAVLKMFNSLRPFQNWPM